MDEPASTVYLVSIVGHWVTWRNLGADATYYTENIVSGSVVPGHETWFSAIREGDRCVVEWRRASTDSPFPDRTVRVVFAHGDRFEIADHTYLVYVEDSGASWADAPTVVGPREAELLDRLRQLTQDELVLAARRFLALPYVCMWWTAEFESSTGWVQYRDGRVPRPRACNVGFVDNAVRLRWEVAVWDLLRGAWVPGREDASFERDVGGHSLATLFDCATRLVSIPVA